MSAKTYEIEVTRVVRSYVDKEDGKQRSFDTFYTFDKDDKKLDLRFRKEVAVPAGDRFFITISNAMSNVSRSGRYPVLWVGEIVSSRPYEVEDADLPF